MNTASLCFTMMKFQVPRPPYYDFGATHPMSASLTVSETVLEWARHRYESQPAKRAHSRLDAVGNIRVSHHFLSHHP